MPDASRGDDHSQSIGWHSRPSGLKLALLFAVALAILLPRAPALDRFITPDENAWSGRSRLFLDALRSGDYARTYQTEHPGVTTMWAGIAGRLLGPLFPVEGAANWNEKDAGIAAGRTFVALANTLALSLAFVFAWQLFGLLPALLGTLLIALDPFHVAHSRFLHLDAMLSSFVLLALLAFLSFLRHRRPAALIVSGIAAGLSWLTKSPSLFLGLIIGLLSLLALGRSLYRRDGRPLPALLWRSAWPLIIWGFVATAVFALLWPAMWVDPLGTVARVLGPALAHARGGHGTPVFFAGQIYPQGLIDASVWQFYPISYLWRTTPVVLLGLLAAGVAVVFRLGPLARSGVRHAALGLLLFALLYGLLMNLGAKKGDRYLLPAFAPLDLLAALGWVSVAAWIADQMRPGPARRALVPLLLVSTVLLQAAFSLPTYPYYLSYYNPLLGGGQKAHRALEIGWGEGLDEAGRYLSSKPNAQDLQVAAWYVTCFAPYFAGNIRGIPIEPEVSDAQLAELLASDYIVVYIHEWQRAMPRPLLEILARQMPEHSVEINGVEYVRIYKLRKPPEPPQPSLLVDGGVLGGIVRLVGYDLPAPREAAPGAALPLTLTWESLATTDAEYTVFVHLVGPDRRPLAQVDSQPLGGAYPTSYWDVGERLADPYRVHIPADLPPGEYRLLAGMYLLSTGERLPLLDDDGQPVGDSIPLGRLTVVEP